MKRSIGEAMPRSGGPSSKPSKSRYVVSAEDRMYWDAKLDHADIGDLSSAVTTGPGGEVTLKSDTSSVTIASATELTLRSNNIDVATSDGQSLDIKTALTASAGLTVSDETTTSLNGPIVIPIFSDPLSVVSGVLSIGSSKAMVDVTSLLTGSPPSVFINAINSGSQQSGQVLFIGLFPTSAADLVGPNALVVSPGFDSSGDAAISSDTSTAAPIATVAGTSVTVTGTGILKFVYVPNFAGGVRGAWVQF